MGVEHRQIVVYVALRVDKHLTKSVFRTVYGSTRDTHGNTNALLNIQPGDGMAFVTATRAASWQATLYQGSLTTSKTVQLTANVKQSVFGHEHESSYIAFHFTKLRVLPGSTFFTVYRRWSYIQTREETRVDIFRIQDPALSGTRLYHCFET